MALLLTIKISGKPSNINIFPPTLSEWATTTFLPLLSQHISIIDNNESSVIFFSDESEMDAFLTNVKLTAEQQALFDEWKATHGIVVTYTAYGLTPAADVTIISPF